MFHPTCMNCVGANPSHHSPYTEKSVIALLIRDDGVKYLVPETYLSQSRPLMARIQRDHCSYSSSLVDLQELDENTAHTVIHYLFTGNYQSLKPVQFQPQPTRMEYQRSGLAYCAARSYGLGGLESLAKEQMKKLEQSLSVFSIIDTARIVFHKLPESDEWYLNHLEESIRPFIEQDRSLFLRRGSGNVSRLQGHVSRKVL
jgi:hypothetical protein